MAEILLPEAGSEFTGPALPGPGASVNECLKWATLNLHASDTARQDAQLLLNHITGKDRGWLLAHESDSVADDQR
ncbi:MAG: hypothetical protein KDI36_09195, partial [Pseudomonadales bacterium]|nr:hypothetical protein [Pseudomonadales bacterium]